MVMNPAGSGRTDQLPDDPQAARMQTLSISALMVGTLQLSRALADRQLADVILEQGIQSALTPPA
jgi:hypothetical protein